MIDATPEERAELERILGECVCKRFKHYLDRCVICGFGDGVLAPIRERDHFKFQMELWRGRFSESERARLDPFHGLTDEKVTT